MFNILLFESHLRREETHSPCALFFKFKYRFSALFSTKSTIFYTTENTRTTRRTWRYQSGTHKSIFQLYFSFFFLPNNFVTYINHRTSNRINEHITNTQNEMTHRIGREFICVFFFEFVDRYVDDLIVEKHTFCGSRVFDVNNPGTNKSL